MPLQTFTTDSPPLDLRDELVHSRDHCQIHPLAQNHVPVFLNLLNAWTTVFAKYLTLNDAVAQAQAQIDTIDIDVDLFVDRVAATVLLKTGNDRNAPLFLAYFGTKQPYEIKRPVLGDELEFVRGWIPALKAESDPDLAALGNIGEPLVAKADLALKSISESKQALRSFRMTGDYSVFVDQVNAGRKAVYGELAKLPHDPLHKDKNLPGHFADWFFKHETRRNKKMSVEASKQRIAALKDELANEEALLAKLEAQEAAKAQAKQEAAMLAAELAAAEQEREALDKKVAELKTKLKR